MTGRNGKSKQHTYHLMLLLFYYVVSFVVEVVEVQEKS